VGFLIEVIWASLMVGLPIAAFTLAIVWWALKRGFFHEISDARALGREMKGMSKNLKKSRKEGAGTTHPLQRKWATFGGGFYGIVAFFTYIVVEAIEISTMIRNFGGLLDFFRQLDFNVLIQIFVEAISNFVTAMIWPVYWMERIDTDRTWIWFVVAYGGYWLGLKLAQVMVQRHPGAEI
jgi:hypothetical protein